MSRARERGNVNALEPNIRHDVFPFARFERFRTAGKLTREYDTRVPLRYSFFLSFLRLDTHRQFFPFQVLTDDLFFNGVH